MPTATFFRLPEEKRQRLMEASWTEISRVRFSDISINRIIAAAHIPRGSFYQYFTDKDDLIRFLLEDMREYFIDQLRDILIEANGDLFSFPIRAYDRFLNSSGVTTPMLTLFVQVLKLNKGFDIQSFMGGDSPKFLPKQLWEVVDGAQLKQNNQEYADHVFHLACAVLAFAIVEVLCDPTQLPQMREVILARMDLLRYGGAAKEYKEVTT